jgi:hypothetical protein
LHQSPDSVVVVLVVARGSGGDNRFQPRDFLVEGTILESLHVMEHPVEVVGGGLEAIEALL